MVTIADTTRLDKQAGDGGRRPRHQGRTARTKAGRRGEFDEFTMSSATDVTGRLEAEQTAPGDRDYIVSRSILPEAGAQNVCSQLSSPLEFGEHTDKVRRRLGCSASAIEGRCANRTV